MKKLFYIFGIFLLNLNMQVFATTSDWTDTWIFWTCVSKSDVRNGYIYLDNIPCIINNAIDFFMGIAWTISLIFIIIWAYQMLFWSLWKDNAKWKTTITYAITWFVLAASSWLIIKFVIDNFGS